VSRAMRRAQAKAEKGGAATRTPTRAIPRASAPTRPTAVAGRGGPLSWRPRFLMDIISELRKVAWPTWQDTRYLTIVVVIMTVILGALLGAIDLGFGWLIDHTLLRT